MMKHDLRWKQIASQGREIMLNSLKFFRNKKEAPKRFIPDLCPTDEAEHSDVYIQRLNELLDDDKRIHEVAITGPYSAGKSSLIRTFLTQNNKHKNITVSLADFNDESTSALSKESLPQSDQNPHDNDSSQKNDTPHKLSKLHSIEKSILQQILYREKANTAPNSRFRRIVDTQKSDRSLWKDAFGLVIAIIGLLYLKEFKSIHGLLDALFNNWDSLQGAFILSAAFFVLIASTTIAKQIFSFMGKYELKMINPINGEVSINLEKDHSVFNIYLEEILYYFKTSKTSLVIFEDLDRFNRLDIFVKLKELNKLINDSEEVKQPVRFIYAVRDDVFKGDNRTKFFDAIIPVIPISNSSNAYPQLKSLLAATKMPIAISEEFLRDTAVYLEDRRLINNIVAEFVIYNNTLNKTIKGFSPEKLLAFVMYKNQFCDDFALLNHGKGILASHFTTLNNLRARYSTDKKKELKEVESLIRQSESEHLKNIEELNTLALFNLFKHFKLTQPVNVTISGTPVPIFEAPEEEKFGQFLKSPRVILNGKGFGHASPTETLKNIFPDYEKRKVAIERRSKISMDGFLSQISQLKSDISRAAHLGNTDLIMYFEREEVFGDIENAKYLTEKQKNFFIHLLDRGYLDEKYHIYISHFYEGNLTSNDIEYVLSVKNKNPLPPETKIDNPDYIIENKYFNDQDFTSNGFFNHDMLEYLVETDQSSPVSIMLKSMEKSFSWEECCKLAKFISDTDCYKISPLLVHFCASFFEEVSEVKLDSDKSVSLLARAVITSLNEEDIDSLINKISTLNLSTLISESEEVCQYYNDLFKRGDKVGDHIEKEINKLLQVDVFWEDVSNFTESNCLDYFVREKEMMVINQGNIEFVLDSNSAKTSPRKGHSKRSGTPTLKEVYTHPLLTDTFIECFDDFHHLILSGEISPPTLDESLWILNEENIVAKGKRALITSSLPVIPNINSVNEKSLWPDLFTQNKVASNWSNIARTVITLESSECLIGFINREENYTALAEHSFENSNLDKDLLKSFEGIKKSIAEILIDEAVSIDAFKALFGHFEDCYDLKLPENIPDDKFKVLVEQLPSSPSLEEYDAVSGVNTNLIGPYLATRIDEVFGSGLIDEITLSEESIIYLLSDHPFVSQENKSKLIESKQDALVTASEKLVTLLSDVMLHLETPPILKLEIIERILQSFKDSTIKVTICSQQIVDGDLERTSRLLSMLGEEYLGLLEQGKQVNLDDTNENRNLLDKLKDADIVSSYKPKRKDKLIAYVKKNI